MEKISFNAILELGNQFNLEYIEIEKKPLVMYGAGEVCIVYLDILKDYNIKPIAICDSSKTKIGTSIEGMIVISLDECLKRYDSFNILISSVSYYDEIRLKLLDYVDDSRILKKFSRFEDPYIIQRKFFLKNNLHRFLELLKNLKDDKSIRTLENVLKGRISNDNKYFNEVCSPLQYFDKDIIKLSDEESIIDGGAYTGDTLKEFSNLTRNKFKSYFAFEPSEMNYKILKKYKLEKYKGDNRINIYNRGLFSSCKTIGFEVNPFEPAACEINENSEHLINVVSIDSMFIDKKLCPPSFIKMDIEGSELDALIGAEQTIKIFKPKLAICVYHKVDDILTIFEYIKNLNLNYSFYLRHYSSYYSETVLYAI